MENYESTEASRKIDKVSFSQYKMYRGCPRQYKLKYIDDLSKRESSIHLIFGSALHTTLQQFLTKLYSGTKKRAMEMDLDMILFEEMKTEFIKEKERSRTGEIPITKLQMEEFWGDGRRIIKWFKSHITEFYSKRGYSLVGIEVVLDNELKGDVSFIGYIDVVIKNNDTGVHTLIDLKTSTKGWNKWAKKDQKSTDQLLLYKKFYSEKFDIPMDKIEVEYQILKRKLIESEYTIPRISKFSPANGSISMNRVDREFKQFVDEVWNDDGTFNMKNPYLKNPGKNQWNCRFCEFKGVHCDGIAD